MDTLDATQVRILGALIEKEATTPDQYPLTINSLTAACNQLSNREPVMSLEDATVMDAVKQLERRSLVHEVHRADSRAKRYRQVFSESLHLHDSEKAIMCVLMLRGAQTVGELRTRTARIHEFGDTAQVELALRSLMQLEPPLVAELPRQPGQKEVRYAHLLSGEPQYVAPPVKQENPTRIEALEQEVSTLRTELQELRARFDEFRAQFQ